MVPGRVRVTCILKREECRAISGNFPFDGSTEGRSFFCAVTLLFYGYFLWNIRRLIRRYGETIEYEFAEVLFSLFHVAVKRNDLTNSVSN